VELINRKHTRRHYHQYINPEREVDAGALEVHGISNEFLDDKPVFASVVEEFIRFVDGAELIIHNAPFDVAFIDYELSLLKHPVKSIRDICGVVDSLVTARKKHPGQKNSLDALCKRYDVDNSGRELHGALLDSEILADVYLRLTGGQTALLLDGESTDGTGTEGVATKSIRVSNKRKPPKLLQPTNEEQKKHDAILKKIQQVSDGNCLWVQQNDR
jgi:DNA polymerase-3 subunit epsilon